MLLPDFLSTLARTISAIAIVMLLSSAPAAAIARSVHSFPVLPGAQTRLQAFGALRGHLRYKLIDMGTFGGPESAIGLGIEGALNQPGIVVGFSATTIPTVPTSNPLLCGGPDHVTPFVTHAFEWNGALVDLGTLPGRSNCSLPFAINANGEIVGFSENGEVDPLTGVNETRAVRWREGQIKALGSFGGNQNAAVHINNRGQIVGNSQNTITDPFAVFGFGSPNSTQSRAFLWEHGQMHDLGTLGGPDALASFINERGQIAGNSYTSFSPNPATGIPTVDPFFWERGRMVDIGSFGGGFGQPSIWKPMNDRGQIIGGSSIPADPLACLIEDTLNCRPFLWEHGNLVNLSTSTVGGMPITADAINDAGNIVGEAAFNHAPLNPYIRRHGIATNLGNLDGDCFGEAFGVNSHDQAVGNAFTCSGDFHDAFLWENGCIVNLNTLIPPNSSLQLVTALFINDRGEIAGTGVPRGISPATVFTTGHAYILVPIRERDSHITTQRSQEECSPAEAAPTMTLQLPPSNSAAMRARWARGFGFWPRH